MLTIECVQVISSEPFHTALFDPRARKTIIYVGGATVAFFRGDVRRLGDDLKLVRPNYLCVVPRVINRVYAQVFVLCATGPLPTG